MSHISKIELVIQSLEDLKEACRQLGFEFMENQKSFKWYGRWAGDTAIPEDIKIEYTGKCEHAIKVAGCEYEVGVIKRGEHYILLWDYFSAGGLVQKIGPNAGVIKQAYTVARVRKEARQKRYRIREKKMEQGVRLVLTV